MARILYLQQGMQGMRQYERLIRIFSLLLPTVGCTEKEGIEEEAFELRLCGPEGLDVMGGLQPAEPAAYTELRDMWVGFDPTQPPTPVVLDAAGELCGGAADVDACMQAFGALPVESEIFYTDAEGSRSYRSVGLTRGDAAEALLSVAEVHGFLGPIDAPHDAGLLAIVQQHSLVCDGRDNAAEVDDGWILFTRTGGGCGEGDDISEHVVHVSRDGDVEVIESELIEPGDPNCAVGRLPAGLCRSRARRGAGVGRFFAEVAELEAASVHAFGQLARELAVHGASRGLVRAAVRSRRDEVRHARVTGALARRYGARPIVPRVRAMPARSLVEVATDNAIEGCVRETFGALVANVQARRAADPRVRRAMRTIAIDETRHAALSWELAAWASARLSVAERRRVSAHARAATERLARELTTEHAEAVHREAGMPRPDEAAALLSALQRALHA